MNIASNRIINRIKGCMFGGALGDALGYPIEFYSYSGITSKYGEKGITFERSEFLISDDTQMTMYTANGLMLAIGDSIKKCEDIHWVDFVHKAYVEWLLTQKSKYDYIKAESSLCWITKDKNMWVERAPGNTCLLSLSKSKNAIVGTVDKPINTSKGCGGVMRMAPVGICTLPYVNTFDDVTIIGCDAAAITHGHIMGYVPAGMLANIIARLTYLDDALDVAVPDALESVMYLYKDYGASEMEAFSKLINTAMELASTDINSVKAIEILGSGWTGEEALAIAIYCALKYITSFKEGVEASVNHSGDSDSTGAITGNILGTFLGFDKIYSEVGSVIDDIECGNTLLGLSNDMSVNLTSYASRYINV